MSDNVVCDEAAEADFERFLDCMGIEMNPKMDDEDRKGFEDAKWRMLSAMKRGSLVIDEKGQPVFTTSDGTAITFREPKGSAYMAQDQKKKGHDVAKGFASMAEMTGQSPQFFANMAGRDLKVCQAIVILFLA